MSVHIETPSEIEPTVADVMEWLTSSYDTGPEALPRYAASRSFDKPTVVAVEEAGDDRVVGEIMTSWRHGVDLRARMRIETSPEGFTLVWSDMHLSRVGVAEKPFELTKAQEFEFAEGLAQIVAFDLYGHLRGPEYVSPEVEELERQMREAERRTAPPQ